MIVMSENSSPSVSRQEFLDLHERTGSLEKTVASLATSVTTLSETVQASHIESKENFGRMNGRFDDLNQTLAQQGKVSWPLVSSCIGLIFMTISALALFITLHVSPVKEKANETHAQLSSLKDTLVVSYENEGKQNAQLSFLNEERIYLREQIEKLKESSSK